MWKVLDRPVGAPFLQAVTRKLCWRAPSLSRAHRLWGKRRVRSLHSARACAWPSGHLMQYSAHSRCLIKCVERRDPEISDSSIISPTGLDLTTLYSSQLHDSAANCGTLKHSRLKFISVRSTVLSGSGPTAPKGKATAAALGKVQHALGLSGRKETRHVLSSPLGANRRC